MDFFHRRTAGVSGHLQKNIGATPMHEMEDKTFITKIYSTLSAAMNLRWCSAQAAMNQRSSPVG
jgi:hypothetical protein